MDKISESDDSSSFSEEMGPKGLQSTMLDLFIAGTETTSTALSWAMLLMIRYPEIQSRVQEEIDRVVGRGRLPELDDRTSLPYTSAVVEEVLRYSCIVPLGVSHCTSSEVRLQNGRYIIPAGRSIMPNLYAITRDPECFSEPNAFNPDHFLDSEGNFKKLEQNMIFGTGKRDA